MMRKFFLLLVVSIFFSFSYSQEPSGQILVKSTDKVKIDGKYYYIHIVRKGETLYSISKLYEVSQMDIAMENPDIYLGLQADLALKIPIKNYTDENDKESFIFHIVQKGETLFGLSRKYQVEINDIVKANPEVQSGLLLSQVVRIPKDKLNTLGQKHVDDSTSFIYHQVRQKEGLYSISKKYNVSQNIIEKYNADILINGLKYGSILKIPKMGADTLAVKDIGNTDKSSETVKLAKTPDLPKVLCDTFKYEKYGKPFNVALLLPFETSKVQADSVFRDLFTSWMSLADKMVMIDRPDIAKSFSMAEFYQGILLAINQIKRDGVSINLSVFDTQKDVLRVYDILNEPSLKKADLIIGPIYPEELKPVADFAKTHKKILVSPLSSSGHLLYDNPYLFQVFPSFQTQIKEFISKIDLCNPGNLMVVYEDDSTNLQMVDQYKQSLKEKLAACQNSDSLHFKEVSYKPGGNTVETKEKINQSLILEKENIIFVPSDNEAFVSDFLSHLFALKTYFGYNVKVYGFPKWQRFKNIPIEYPYTLNQHLFTQTYLNYTAPGITSFITEYRDYFKSEPTQFSIQGYDMALYFLKALEKFGSDFRYCIPNYQLELLQSDYRFRQANPNGGFENSSIFLIQYTKDFDILKIK